MAVYLHELVDVVPTRSEAYLDGIGEHHGRGRSTTGEKDTLLGLFEAIEATGTWPLGVNIWHNRSWDRQAEMMAIQFAPRKQSPELKRWWLGNLHLRSGGFDRLIESTDYTPDVAGLRATGVGGELFLHQIVRTVPGRVDEFLAAFGEEGAPALAGAGAHLVGAYRVCLSNHEAIVLLAFPRARDLGPFLAAWHGSDAKDGASEVGGAAGSALRRWRAREDDWVRGKDTLLLKPRHFLDSPWHP